MMRGSQGTGEKRENSMSILHGRVTAPSRRRRVLEERTELIMKTCTALLITVVAAAVILLRAELCLSGFSRIANGG
jgi:hypothetical protein